MGDPKEKEQDTEVSMMEDDVDPACMVLNDTNDAKKYDSNSAIPPRPRQLRRERTRISIKPKPEFCVKSVIGRVQVHGLMDFYEATSFIARCFWISLIAVCLSIAVFSISRSVHEFIEHPVQTSITKVPQTSMVYPPIYICPSNYMDFEKIRRHGLQKEAFLVRSLIPATNSRFFKPLLEDWFSQMVGENGNETIDREYSMSEIRRQVLNVGFSESDIFKSCILNGNRTTINCTGYFVPVLDIWNGICYQVSVERFPPQVWVTEGLNLFIDLHTNSYSPENQIESFLTGVSFKFGKDANTFGSSEQLAGPGWFVKYSMYKQINRLLSSKSVDNRCLTRDQVPKFVYLNTIYSPLACIYDCYFQITVPKCNCTYYPFDVTILNEKYWYMTNCLTPMGSRCDKRNESEQAMLQKCYGTCIETCETEEHLIQSTATELGSPILRMRAREIKKTHNLSEKADPEYWKTSAVMVHIGFAEMNHLVISQSEAITIVQLVSDIGGQAGLWLGASIFSVCQLATLVMAWCYSKLHKEKKSFRGP